MRMSRVAAAFVLLSACVATPPADLPDRPIAGFDRAEARMDCAPWDGPAVTVTLSAASTDPDSVVAAVVRRVGRGREFSGSVAPSGGDVRLRAGLPVTSRGDIGPLAALVSGPAEWSEDTQATRLR